MSNKNRNKNDYYIDGQLKKYINNIMDKEETLEAQTVLYINFEYLNMLDNQWTEVKLIPNFSSGDEDKFNISWQGYLCNTSFNPATCNKLNDEFLFTIKDVKRITDTNFRKKFIDVYTLICTDVVEDPLLEYIPNLYLHSDEFIEEFYRHLVHTLKAKERNNKESIFADSEKIIDNFLKELVEDILANILNKGHDRNRSLVEICSSLNIEIPK